MLKSVLSLSYDHCTDIIITLLTGTLRKENKTFLSKLVRLKLKNIENITNALV